jgi:hypothetical protein
MVPLALGLCLDFYVVAFKVTESQSAAATVAAIMLLFFYGLWFGFTLYSRRQHTRTAGQRIETSKSEEKQLAI